MQFPESWLREFCNPPLSTQQLADTLTMAGMEVEAAVPAAPPFSQVVVGEIREAVQHPNADRLRVCQVDTGQGSLLNIVCGAPNARVGIRVPVALVGAELPPGDDGKPFSIKLGKLRGVESQGMLCSARELKLSDDHGGLLELPADAPLGRNIRDVLHLDDTVFTLKLTPNLGHCLSVYGVARELAALTGAPLKPWAPVPVTPSIDAKLAVKVSAPELCGRFSGRVVRGVNTKAQTPAWMVDRLARCGQRSVTALVDISNYVMFESGQPTHIFDLDKIHGGLDVRWGRTGEELKLLNGNTVQITPDVGVIADERGIESLAGIMGGDATAVNDDTHNIYIEAAFWWPESVAGRSRRYNFATDAGHRFERGVDPSRTVEHIERITALVQEICGGEAAPVDDQQPNMPQRPAVTLRVARAARVIGMPVDQAQCVDTFRRLAMSVQEGAGEIRVTPAMHRFDLTIEEDLIEEVVRMAGFDSLPTSAPLAPVLPLVRSESKRSRFALRRSLAALGYQETINFSFVQERWETELVGNAHPIRLLNPIASQMSVMRSSMLGSLLHVLKYNLDRKTDRLRIFELGRVFSRDSSVEATDSSVAGIAQPLQVAGLAYGPQSQLQWGEKSRPTDFFDIKGDLQALLARPGLAFEKLEHPAFHPGRCAAVMDGSVRIGVVGELHPRWRQAYELPLAPLMFELDAQAALRLQLPHAQALPRQLAVQRDIAVIVSDEIAHDAVIAVAQGPGSADGLLKQVQLFDVFKPAQAVAGMGAHEKSLALRLTLGDDDQTLTDAQIEAEVQAVLARLGAGVSARIRS